MFMKKTLTTLFFTLTAYIAICNSFPKPILVLNEHGNRSINGPLIVIYDNQTVIYRKSKSEYYFVKLTSKEYSKLLLGVNSYFLSKQTNDSSHIHTDSTVFYINDASWTTLTLWEKNKKTSVTKFGTIKMNRQSLQKTKDISFEKIVDRLSSFESIHASKWLPDKIEINLWNINYTGYKNLTYIDWNREWPDTSDISSKRWKNYTERYYSIYLPKKYWSEFIKIYNDKFPYKSESISLFKMNGLSWQPSFRFPLPNENFWRNEEQ